MCLGINIRKIIIFPVGSKTSLRNCPQVPKTAIKTLSAILNFTPGPQG
jgi:hypothetical protein